MMRSNNDGRHGSTTPDGWCSTDKSGPAVAAAVASSLANWTTVLVAWQRGFDIEGAVGGRSLQLRLFSDKQLGRAAAKALPIALD